MTTSNSTSAFRLTKIDEALRGDHCYLDASDECYCLGDYISQSNYNASPVNNLISNFKKCISKRDREEFRYKKLAIIEVAGYINNVLRPETAQTGVFVPIPPSKNRSDPLYDDRMSQALRAVTKQLNVRELINVITSTEAHHRMPAGVTRPSPEAIYQNLAIDQAMLSDLPSNKIVLVDDVLTNGSHFKACKRLIQEHIPDCEIIGLFIGRTKRPAADFTAIFD